MKQLSSGRELAEQTRGPLLRERLAASSEELLPRDDTLDHPSGGFGTREGRQGADNVGRELREEWVAEFRE